MYMYTHVFLVSYIFINVCFNVYHVIYIGKKIYKPRMFCLINRQTQIYYTFWTSIQRHGKHVNVHCICQKQDTVKSAYKEPGYKELSVIRN